jgi:type II restriction enzyme
MLEKQIQIPSLFGIKKSNRNFLEEESWGKNVFNSSFPTSLCCFFEDKQLKHNYLSIDKNGDYIIDECSVEHLFGISSKNDDIFFAFESVYTPFQTHVIGNLPRTDLVIQNSKDGKCMRGLEVKLTALPDNSTCNLEDSKFSSEIVVRPDSIVYLACYLIDALEDNLSKYLTVTSSDIVDWTEPSEVLKKTNEILTSLESISKEMYSKQLPFLLQPIWKTEGKSPRLTDNCLDVFVWSDAGFLWFITQIATSKVPPKTITRPLRTAVWLYKMLLDFSDNKIFDHKKIIDSLSFNTKNDKAFSANGKVTYSFLKCKNLEKPRIKKEHVKDIILGGGQNLLSPERRFDAIIYNSPELFE